MAYRKIKLTQGQYAIVDREDYESLAAWKWQASWDRCTKSFYATRKGGMRMHRQILNAPQGMLVDHKNQHTLDNRRFNLRLATRSQNAMNQKIRSDNISGYKGVSWNPASRKWCARIRINKREINVGFFEDPKEAYAAYCKAATEIYGEFARLH